MELFKNAAFGTLAGAVSIDATEVVLAAGQGARFPSPTAPDYFWLVLENALDATNFEVVKVTARADDTLTCTATTKAWAIGAKVRATIVQATAEMLHRGSNWRRFSPGQRYSTPNTDSKSVEALADAELVFIGFPVPLETAFDAIGVEVITLAESSVIRLGIYRDDGRGKPGALVLSAGTIDSSTTGVKEIVISQTLAPDLYWLALQPEGGVPSVRAFNSSTGNSLFTPIVTGSGGVNGWRATGTPGSLADPAPAVVIYASRTPMIWLKAA